MKPSKLKLDLTKTDAESASMFSKIPDGDYVVIVAHSQFKEGKNEGAAGLQVGFMVEEGAHKGKMVQDYINIANSNEQAVEIGMRRLKGIMVAQNRKSYVLDTDADLVSKEKFMISVALEKSMYKEKEIESSAVKKIYAIEKKTGTASASKPSTEKTPPKTTVEEADAHVEADGDDDTPPWMK